MAPRRGWGGYFVGTWRNISTQKGWGSWVIRPAWENKVGCNWKPAGPVQGFARRLILIWGNKIPTKKYIYISDTTKASLKTQEKWQGMFLKSQQELIKRWQASKRIAVCLLQRWSLKVFQKSRTLPGRVNTKLPGVKKEQKQKGLFCLARENQEGAAGDVFRAEPTATSL